MKVHSKGNVLETKKSQKIHETIWHFWKLPKVPNIHSRSALRVHFHCKILLLRDTHSETRWVPHWNSRRALWVQLQGWVTITFRYRLIQHYNMAILAVLFWMKTEMWLQSQSQNWVWRRFRNNMTFFQRISILVSKHQQFVIWWKVTAFS